MAFWICFGFGRHSQNVETCIERRIVLDLLFLNIQGQIDQDRPGPAVPDDPEGLAENPGHHGRILNAVRFLGDRLDHLGDVTAWKASLSS